jgi:hypothetical protein
MRTEAKGYFLKEYGSWSVLSVSFLTGLIVSRGFSWQAVPLFLSLGLLINSKQAFTKWARRKEDTTSLLVFLGQSVVAACVMIAIFRTDVLRLLPLLVFPTAYLISNRLAGEHHFVVEILGFTLISLAAVLAKFLVTGGIDVRLFVAVAFYFSAGVFKVKALLLKKTQDRILAVLWVIFAVFMYQGFHISRVVLLPLFDNVVAALTLYKVKLKTTGWIEVVKSIVFLGLMAALY